VYGVSLNEYNTQFLLYPQPRYVMKLIFAVLYVSLNDGPYTLL